MKTVTRSIYSSCLTSPLCKKIYDDGGIPSPVELSSAIFLDVRQCHGFKPDYVYKHELEHLFNKGGSLSQLLNKSIKSLSKDFLRSNGDLFVVPIHLFHEWQSLILQTSPLLLTVAAIQQDCEAKACGDPDKIILRKLHYSALPEIDSRPLKHLIAKKGLSEVHMHLNGTTEADKVWLDALKNPLGFYQALRDSYNCKISEQFFEILHEKKKPENFYDMLCKARYIRQKLIDHIWRTKRENPHLSEKEFRSTFHQFNIFDKNESYDPDHPIVVHLKSLKNKPPLVKEAIFLNHALLQLQKNSRIFAAMFHYYILCQSCFNKLLVQQISQTGFEQFQRIADNKLRDPSESEYQYRFHQIAEHLPEGENHLEGRFAPKSSIAKNNALLTAIQNGWQNFKNDTPSSKKIALSLTAHFIKKPDKLTLGYRHHHLRRELMYNGIYLAHMRKTETFSQLLTSIDAAANELDASPEVFSPVFRLMRAKGCKRFTYHVGEDFFHIISGLRSIWEAITFLDLQSGDRIGHGTALGISPSLWKRQIGSSITLKAEEWLDDLIFLFFFLIENEYTGNLAIRYREQALALAYQIYHEEISNLSVLREAWELRKLDPIVALSPFFEEMTPISSWRKREHNLTQELKKTCSPKSFDLFKRYHLDKEVKDRGKQLKSINLDEIPAEIITQIQTRIIQEMNNKQIAMEVMPSSNVRISIYNNYKEHHIFRLIGLTEDSPKACPIMCVASDDPGIFASCLQNEYAHIFKGLLDFGLNESEALSKIEWLIDNSWAYRFKSHAQC